MVTSLSFYIGLSEEVFQLFKTNNWNLGFSIPSVTEYVVPWLSISVSTYSVMLLTEYAMLSYFYDSHYHFQSKSL